MKDKVEDMIKSGMKLFARQGFNATSVQEIAADSGISKGAFYLHFKSKDDFLLEILNYNFNIIHTHMTDYENQDLPDRKKFECQLNAMFTALVEHRDFFIMLSKEQAVPRNEEIKEVIYRNLLQSHQFYKKGLLSVYGEESAPYSSDLAIILEGLFHSYLRLIMIDPAAFDLKGLPAFIMRRMDSVAAGILEDEPFLNQKQMEGVLAKSEFLLKEPDVPDLLKEMRRISAGFGNREELAVSLEVLEEEVAKDTPRIPVIQGMLSNFSGIPELKPFTEQIAAFYGIKKERPPL